MLAIWSLVPLPFLNPALTSGSSWFIYCWSLAWRILSITLLACEMSAVVQEFEHSLSLPFFGIGMKIDHFQSCGHYWVFQICWHIECSTFTPSLRIWNSSAGIPSPPLALFIVMLKILHTRLQQYVNHELPDVQAEFRKGRGTRDQIANIRWIIEKAREFQKNIYFCFTDYAKALTVWITINCGKFWKRWAYQTTLTCLLRSLYAGQEATVRTGHGKTDWFQTGKGVHQACILSPCLFNCYAEYIMRNTELEEA